MLHDAVLVGCTASLYLDLGEDLAFWLVGVSDQPQQYPAGISSQGHDWICKSGSVLWRKIVARDKGLQSRCA